MKKTIFLSVMICFTFLMGGCGSEGTSSAPQTENEKSEQSKALDEKLVHRFEQRGFSTEDMLISQSIQNGEQEGEIEKEPTPSEKMAESEDWLAVKLVVNEEVNFSQKTIEYFEEDLNENYPPPKKNTLDVIATVMYKNDAGYILDGLIRNGFTDHSFTRDQIKSLVMKLVTDQHHEWIVTRLENIERLTEVGSGEAVPFRISIPEDKVRIPEFDHTQFGYHAIIEQPNVTTNNEGS